MPYDFDCSSSKFVPGMNAHDILTNMMSFLYSFMKLDDTRIQSLLFAGKGSDGKYYYHITLLSEYPLSLDFYDFKSSQLMNGNSVYDSPKTPPNVGSVVLLCSGHLHEMANPTIYNDKPDYMSNYPNYIKELWIGDETGPSYADGIQKQLTSLGGIISTIATGIDPFFVEGSLAFFDSCDADFGEIPVSVDNPEQIILDIFDDSKDISYITTTYPQIMEEYSDNIFALFSFAKSNKCPYFPA